MKKIDEINEKNDEIDEKIDEIHEKIDKIDQKNRRNRRKKATTKPTKKIEKKMTPKSTRKIDKIHEKIDKINENDKIDDDFVVFVKIFGRFFPDLLARVGGGAGSDSGFGVAGCGDSGTKGWRAVWCDKDTKGRERTGKERWGLGARIPALWLGACRFCNAEAKKVFLFGGKIDSVLPIHHSDLIWRSGRNRDSFLFCFFFGGGGGRFPPSTHD